MALGFTQNAILDKQISVLSKHHSCFSVKSQRGLKITAFTLFLTILNISFPIVSFQTISLAHHFSSIKPQTFGSQLLSTCNLFQSWQACRFY